MCPLDPQNLTPANSLNRVRVMDLPNLRLDAGVRGRSGYQLVSAWVLSRLIRQYTGLLHLDPALNDHELRQAFDHCLTGKGARFRPGVMTAAETIAQRLGRNLGYLLLTLRQGDQVNRAARPEWDESYWEHWAKVDMVWLAGGLVGGRLGARMKRYALSVFGEADILDFTLEISPYSAYLPLIGAALSGPPDVEAVLVFDFGSTMMKRGCALYNDRHRQLQELYCLPPVPTQWEAFMQAFPDPDDAAAAFFKHIVATIIDTWRYLRAHNDLPLARVVRISLAAYIDKGQPMQAQDGAYAQLCRLTDNLQAELVYQLTPHLGVVDLQLIHDGTAAASVYVGDEDTAVITIGTALGVGFPPEKEGAWTMHNDFFIAQV